MERSFCCDEICNYSIQDMGWLGIGLVSTMNNPFENREQTSRQINDDMLQVCLGNPIYRLPTMLT